MIPILIGSTTIISQLLELDFASLAIYALAIMFILYYYFVDCSTQIGALAVICDVFAVITTTTNNPEGVVPWFWLAMGFIQIIMMMMGAAENFGGTNDDDFSIGSL